MPIVVIDTNVIVSALLSPNGKSAKVLDLALGKQLQILYDSRILSEYEEVLHRPKFPFKSEDKDNLLSRIILRGVAVTVNPLDIPFIDESDKKFYEIAVQCNARLITGNLKHFPQDGIALSVSDFLEAVFIA